MTDESTIPAQPVESGPAAPQLSEEALPVSAKPGRARWIALGAAAVLSAVAVGGGVGFGVLQVSKKPAKPVASAAPKTPAGPTYGALSNGNHFGALRDLLVPVPVYENLGPDMYQFGNDSELDPAQYHQLWEKQFSFLSTADRTAMENGLAADHLKGIAVRSYQVSGQLVVWVQLSQENQDRAKSAAGTLKQLSDRTGMYRAGPAVPGFPAVRCFLPPLATGDKLDQLECNASVGDMLVTLDAQGTAPLDTASAIDLMRQQLTRLAIPGAQT